MNNVLKIENKSLNFEVNAPVNRYYNRLILQFLSARKNVFDIKSLDVLYTNK